MRWTPGSIGLLLALGTTSAGLAIGCGGRAHGDGVVVMGSAACESCHLANYDAAVRPVHKPNFPTSCAECHTTASWTECIHSPATETKFNIVAPSKHAGIACLECHSTKLSYDFATNVDCTSSNCHPQGQFDGNHPQGAGGSWSDSDKEFCRTCHPDGGHLNPHNETAFPITTGIHAMTPSIGCTTSSTSPNGGCHNLALSTDFTKNADCTSTCHTATNTEGFNTPAPIPGWSWKGKHNGASFNAANHSFCRTCHPTGQDATATAMTHASVSGTFSQNHEGAGGNCADCHTPALSPPPCGTATPCLNLPDFSQDIDCSTHHHSSRDGNQGN